MWNRYCKPSEAPERVRDLTTIMTKLMARIGIMTFMLFSIPPLMPFETTKQQKARITMNMTMVTGSRSDVVLNNSTVSTWANLLVTANHRYLSTHAHTVVNVDITIMTMATMNIPIHVHFLPTKSLNAPGSPCLVALPMPCSAHMNGMAKQKNITR